MDITFRWTYSKRPIDEQLTTELKVQLSNPSLSIMEIAQLFNFQ